MHIIDAVPDALLMSPDCFTSLLYYSIVCLWDEACVALEDKTASSSIVQLVRCMILPFALSGVLTYLLQKLQPGVHPLSYKQKHHTDASRTEGIREHAGQWQTVQLSWGILQSSHRVTQFHCLPFCLSFVISNPYLYMNSEGHISHAILVFYLL